VDLPSGDVSASPRKDGGRDSAGCFKCLRHGAWKADTILFPVRKIILISAVIAVSVAGSRVFADELQPKQDPNAACPSCHRGIYERYRHTPMANGSGLAADGFTPADFIHPASGIHYRIYEDAGQVFMSYDRESTAPGGPLHGRQQLLYFLGSGKRGRTYLFEQQGYWFEAPINWYAKKGIWDMTPNYLQAKEMPLTLPVDLSCLRCHASQVQPSLPDARNHFASQPFLDGGVTCNSCHGDPAAHITTRGRAPILNPSRLDPVRRDSVCLNCHLEGKVIVVRQGKSLGSFKPGDDIFDYALFFVRSQESGSGGRATSQWEALQQSACKRASGDKLTCTTCHDPHSSPAPEERVQFFRRSCLGCHSQPVYATQHHPEQPDCSSCHMPRSSTTDIAHEQVTDHRIQRYPAARSTALPSDELVALNETRVSDRDLGLAYAQLAVHGNEQAARRAYKLLLSAEEAETRGQPDHELHTELGFLEQLMGQTEAAKHEYEAALKADAFDSVAEGNLALIEARSHQSASAVRLWQTAFDHDPAQLAAGENLAEVECGLGQRDAALTTLDRVLLFSPDDQRALSLQNAIRSGTMLCKAQ
jgi:predicted CXXCH cytochrome family protein